MPSVFKVGDIVICLVTDSSLIQGGAYEVTRVRDINPTYQELRLRPWPYRHGDRRRWWVGSWMVDLY